MASIKPATDRPRQLRPSRFWPRVFSAVSLVSVTLAPVAALSLWLLISDPVTAGPPGRSCHLVNWLEIASSDRFRRIGRIDRPDGFPAAGAPLGRYSTLV